MPNPFTCCRSWDSAQSFLQIAFGIAFKKYFKILFFEMYVKIDFWVVFYDFKWYFEYGFDNMLGFFLGFFSKIDFSPKLMIEIRHCAKIDDINKAAANAADAVAYVLFSKCKGDGT